MPSILRLRSGLGNFAVALALGYGVLVGFVQEGQHSAVLTRGQVLSFVKFCFNTIVHAELKEEGRVLLQLWLSTLIPSAGFTHSCNLYLLCLCKGASWDN